MGIGENGDFHRNEQATHHVYVIGRPGVGRLAIMPAPDGGQGLEASLTSVKAQGFEVVLSLLGGLEMSYLGLTAEPEMCEQIGLGYWNLPIRDFGTPEVAAAHLVVAQVVGALASEHSVVIHCRAGIGRSSTVAALVLREEGLTAVEAFTAVSRARGMRVPETKRQRRYVEQWAAMNK
jgi:protein tyrosine phosphatase (PTP) superfamily phosphohydrolase (DUF442 family)